MHAPAYRSHDEQSHLVPGPPLRRPGIEVRERPGKHQIGESGMLSGKHPKRLDDRDQLASGILRRPDLVQVLPQQPEALEEHLPDQPGLVAEQLVYGRSRGARMPMAACSTRSRISGVRCFARGIAAAYRNAVTRHRKRPLAEWPREWP